ncbi:hypothetical protein RchiOBHm_Chr5g0031781 [Rosa chinensis]|uniref:Uncharacterized protein n=1 Tax=Rosa chinensis TaxID=74649 RepID=A0A2P6QA90_ROSCH|nr:hypothetical protein RchiOBHm_Chr5g0031781 [Rosa chinensis]
MLHYMPLISSSIGFLCELSIRSYKLYSLSNSGRYEGVNDCSSILNAIIQADINHMLLKLNC